MKGKNTSLDKETEDIKKKEMKTLELKENCKIKNSLHVLSSGMDVMGEYVSESDDRAMKIIQYAQKR